MTTAQENLNISLIQTHLHWQDVDANLNHFTDLISDIATTDLIVLPEMFTTGFTMQPELNAEEQGGNGLQWMQQIAKQKNCAITGSIAVKENNHYYNRLYFVFPDGTYQQYNKRHLFRMGNEHQHYTAGDTKIIIDYLGWKICPLVCYDLRFPIWSRNTKQNTYDVLLYVANWPEARSFPWQQLLIARAIENQSYVVGVNRVGLDGNNINHSGNSLVLSPKGETLLNFTANNTKCKNVSLNYFSLIEFRKQFPAMLDADEFTIS